MAHTYLRGHRASAGAVNTAHSPDPDPDPDHRLGPTAHAALATV